MLQFKKIQFLDLEAVDPNTDYAGAQTIFVDFDGANNVSYNNEALDVYIDNIDVMHSALSMQEQFQIITDLNNTFADTGVTFSVTSPANEEYSTIYVGKTDALAQYGDFAGLAENIDVGNRIKNDKAFVFTDKLSSTQNIGSTIVHETAHLLGYQHNEDEDNSSLSSYALEADAEVTLQIVNNFNTKANYFLKNYPDDEVWLFFMNTGGAVTYTDTSEQPQTVSDTVAFQLSSVKDGTFTIENGQASSRVYAALGETSPFQGSAPPGIFDTDIPYALMEWTVAEGANDNCDVSYEDTFSFPTTLTVKDDGGTQTDKSAFNNGTTPEIVINALESVIAKTPVGPSGEEPGGDKYPQSGDAAGWGPLVPTVSGNAEANRWIGSSKYWPSGTEASTQQAIYSYVPSFNDYLAYLKTNETVLFPEDNSISGWYIDYSGNTGYSFYLSVTGTDDNYGLQIHDVRYNTTGGETPTPPWTADPTALTALNGTITVAANNTNVAYDSYQINGNWTDITIYSGASLLDGDFMSGPIVTGTGDFASGGTYNLLNTTIIASISASIASGLLGNSSYMEKIQADQPKGTMYWFEELLREDYETTLFSGGWSESQKFYDPYWETMTNFTDMQGYLSPFSDRWSNISPDFTLDTGYSMTWELGALPLTSMANVDFTGSGYSDILWQRNNDKNLYSWHDGDLSEGWTSMGSSPFPLQEIGDFDGNGISDLLWERQSDDNFYIWYDSDINNGWTRVGSSPFVLSGVGDFDGSGTSDILWQRESDDSYYYWADGKLANGWTRLGSSPFELLAVGDFDGNGISDLLWKRESDGNIYVWHDSDPANGWNLMGNISGNFTLLDLGDFDGNGKSDILWKRSDGGIYAWDDGDLLTNGWRKLGSSPFDFFSVGDYGGNGKDDICWQRASDGNIYSWADGELANGWDKRGTASNDFTNLSNLA